MYAAANLKNRYKEDYVSTASPADLIIMLYEGCIKKIKLAKIYLESGSIEQTSASLQNAQDIIMELMQCLDMSFEIAKDLMSLYDYILYELMQMNIKKDMEKSDKILEILVTLKDAWMGAKLKLDNNLVCSEMY
jgi:flagellar protein FliS